MAACKVQLIKLLSVFMVLWLLPGCAALSPYSELTKLNLRLTASDQLNPDLHGRPSPVVLRLIELKHPVAFENADFFSLYERAKESLSPDLVTSEELELRPGQSIELKLSIESTSRYVGVLAAYRDLAQARWRYVVPVTPMGLTSIELVFERDGVRHRQDRLAQADQ